MRTSSKPLIGVHLFQGLSPTTLDAIKKAGREQSYTTGDLILMVGDPCTAAYFILHGKVKVFRTALDGRDQILTQLGEGDSFNTVPPLLGELENHSNAQAVTDVVLFALPVDAYRDLLQQYSDFSFALLSNFAHRLSNLSDMVETISLHPVRARLAGFLIEQADGIGLSNHWTQEEMAARLGTVRDVIGRTLRAFVDEGLIRKERQRIILLDRKRLERISES